MECEESDIEGQYARLQLICLANLESLNAVLIEEQVPQVKRLERLNQVAIRQMRILTEKHQVFKFLNDSNGDQ